MLRKDAKVELIKNVPLFAQCTKKELSAIATVADLVEVPKGTKLVSEGGWDRDFMIIVDGAADVRRGGRKVNTLKAGDFFGEIALIIEGPRIATVTATEPTRVLVLREQQFWPLLEEIPALQRRVLRALAERLRPLVV
jgi:CRP-like cAMP-binding protein